MPINGQIIEVKFTSDICFEPIAREITKYSNSKYTFVAGDMNQHFQILDEINQSQVLILNFSSEFFFKEKKIEDVILLAESIIIAIKATLEKSSLWIIINTVEFHHYDLIGISYFSWLKAINHINSMLIELCQSHQQVRLVDIAWAIKNCGYKHSISFKNDFVFKSPYKKDLIVEVARQYFDVLEQIYSPRKKVIIVDADNTLWGGIIGEDGISGIDVSANYPGIVHRKFQEQLLAAKESGLLLVLVSKNNKADVLEAFEKISMPLKLTDFVTMRINWSPKSLNIYEIAGELNLGVDSMIFIDDNEFELEEVRYNLEGVNCYKFESSNPDAALKILSNAQSLKAWRLTKEDQAKSKQYEGEVKRKSSQSQSTSLEHYLKTLEIKLEYGINRRSEISRISQLTNKTNQFNLTTKRYSEIEITKLMEISKVYDFRVIDKYGDMGIIGVSIVIENKIDTFLMSCRALGREIEATMLNILIIENKNIILEGQYTRTKKNKLVENFYESNGFSIKSEEGGEIKYRLANGPSLKNVIPITKISYV